MNVSALDLASGIYGLQQSGLTAQGPANTMNPVTGTDVATKNNLDNLSFPTHAAKSPPNGFGSWSAYYQSGQK